MAPAAEWADFMRYFLALSLLLTSLAHAAERPNIIVVFIDDMGWGDFSCFGNRDARTPNVDRLAAEGLRFSQFYVNCADLLAVAVCADDGPVPAAVADHVVP